MAFTEIDHGLDHNRDKKTMLKWGKTTFHVSIDRIIVSLFMTLIFGLLQCESVTLIRANLGRRWKNEVLYFCCINASHLNLSHESTSFKF